MFKELVLESKQSLIIMVIILMISALFVSLFYWYWSNAYDYKQYENKQLQSIMSKYSLAKSNAELLDKYKIKYQMLKQKKLIESHNRLSWINAMENAVKRKLITSVQYEINQHVKLNDAKLTRAFPGVDVFRSSMTLNMGLLHEGDLYAFFKELARNAQGLFEIKSCELNAAFQAKTGILKSVTSSNLKAKCHVNWYSVKSRSA